MWIQEYPWDLKLFYKWKNGKPILLIAHSDDFRWFGDESELSDWTLLVNTFGKHKYKVTDVSDNDFVGINITREYNLNYYMDQTRMIDEILAEALLTYTVRTVLTYRIAYRLIGS